MRKVLIVGSFFLALATAVWAAGLEYRASYNISAAADAPSRNSVLKCKDFSGSDDNVSACKSWCGEWKAAHALAECSCVAGKCEP